MEYRCGHCGNESNTRCGHHELLAEVKRLNLQLGEVTAHRDRLRDMLNDVRGMVFAGQPELAARILRRIDPVEDEVADKR